MAAPSDASYVPPAVENDTIVFSLVDLLKPQVKLLNAFYDRLVAHAETNTPLPHIIKRIKKNKPVRDRTGSLWELFFRSGWTSLNYVPPTPPELPPRHRNQSMLPCGVIKMNAPLPVSARGRTPSPASRYPLADTGSARHWQNTSNIPKNRKKGHTAYMTLHIVEDDGDTLPFQYELTDMAGIALGMSYVKINTIPEPNPLGVPYTDLEKLRYHLKEAILAFDYAELDRIYDYNSELAV